MFRVDHHWGQTPGFRRKDDSIGSLTPERTCARCAIRRTPSRTVAAGGHRLDPNLYFRSLRRMDVRAFLDELKRQPGYDGQVVHERFIPPRKARYARLDPPVPQPLIEALRAQEITELYAHQVEAIAAVRRGEHVVVVTATASGKTLCYNLPVLETLLADPKARALYLFPTKALAQDQADALAEFGLADLVFGTYDGDTPAGQRRAIRERAQVILTNPDMLHLGILPQHYRWANLFRHLRFVVIDDVHIYRGVFG